VLVVGVPVITSVVRSCDQALWWYPLRSHPPVATPPNGHTAEWSHGVCARSLYETPKVRPLDPVVRPCRPTPGETAAPSPWRRTTLLRSPSQFRPNCATPDPPLGHHPIHAEGAHWSEMSKGARGEISTASRVDMPQRAALESAFSLVLGAAQTRVPCCNILADANRGNWRRNCQRRGSAYWGARRPLLGLTRSPGRT